MMRKLTWTAIVCLLALQCVRPTRNVGQGATSLLDASFMASHPPPAGVQRTLERACYDCHSNSTRYTWYANVQPIGWMVEWHVRDGKRVLNFSEMARLTPERAQSKLEKCIDELEEKRMPLGSYTLVHRDARLTPAEVTEFVGWAERTIKEIQSTPLRPAFASVEPSN